MSPSKSTTGGLGLSNSPSFSFIGTISNGGPSSEGDEGDIEGVSIAGAVDKASLSDSTLFLVPASSLPFTILDGVLGEGGDEGIDSRGRAVRRLMVTLLEVGSGGGSVGIRVGV